jgi:RNA polymerase sigma factor (sigma-70 family)
MIRLPDISPETIERARMGVLVAIDEIIVRLQPGVFNLAVRMLGHREDAHDACQEILLKVITHLGGFRGEAAFTTWVYQIARNHLLRAATRAREAPEVDFDALQARLAEGLALSADAAVTLTPEDKAAAREIAVGCTQGMLMILDREHRLAWLLDIVFGLSSVEAAGVLEITPAAYRQRLSRARRDLQAFMATQCGLVSERAACRCERQVRPLRLSGASAPALLGPGERAQVDQNFGRLVRMGDAALVFRAHPEYAAPEAMIAAVRAVLRDEGFWDQTQPM